MDISSPHAAWTSVAVRRPGARVRLYCFPFLGSSASFYLPLARALPEFVETCSLEIPGHGGRSREPVVDYVGALVDGLADVVAADSDDMPFAFFGHCSGGLLAYEVAQALARDGRRGPALLTVSALAAPRIFTRRINEFARLPRRIVPLVAELMSESRLRAATASALAKREFLSYMRFRPSHQQSLDCEVRVTGGLADPVWSPDELAEWSACTTSGRAPVRLYPGRHFYVLDHWPALAGDLADDLTAAGT